MTAGTYKVIDKDAYYRKGVYRHFSEDCKCSVSMTARLVLPGRAFRFGTRETFPRICA